MQNPLSAHKPQNHPIFRVYALFLGVLLVFSSFSFLIAAEKPQLRGGWYLWDPYQFIETGVGFSRLTGLDIKLVTAIGKKAGYTIHFEEVSWKQHQNDLKQGRRDIAAGATKTPDRGAYAYFSIPYRDESNSLFTLKKAAKKIDFSSVDDLLIQVKKHQFRLGVVDGFVHVDPKINAFIADGANKDLIFPVENTLQNLDNLNAGVVDGILADRIDGSTVAWRTKDRENIQEQFIGSVPIHLMFSKKTTPLKTVEIFNKSILSLKEGGEYADILQEYYFPILLMQTIDRAWFFIIDMIGTIAFAISGLVIAYRERTSIFGTFVLAGLPAVGGGIMRDLLVGREPIGVLKSPAYLFAIIVTVLLGAAIIRMAPFIGRIFRIKKLRHDETAQSKTVFFRHLIDIFDALGLAAFTIVAVAVAVVSRVQPLWLWGPILAVITGVGGGIVRDMLTRERFILSMRGIFYPEVAILWGLALSLFLVWHQTQLTPEEMLFAVITTLIGAFMTRLVSIISDIRGPSFVPKNHNSSDEIPHNTHGG